MTLHKYAALASLAVSLLTVTALQAQETIDLAGAWELKTTDSARQPDTKVLCWDSIAGRNGQDWVMLPGSMLTNGKGDPVSVNTPWTASLYDSSFYFNPFMAPYRKEGHMKLPFFLTPERHYVGEAWYRRQVYIPKSWNDQRITLFLERPHIETTLYVNGKEAGHQTSLSVPHHYDVTKLIQTGASNEIVIRVYNGIENVGVGQDSHSVTDHTQGNWNGIVGRMELTAQKRHLRIKSVKVVPDVQKREARIEVKLENHVKAGILIDEYYIYAEATPINSRKKATSLKSETLLATRSTMHLTIPMGDQMQTWDEFSPVVYRLTVYAGNNKGDDVYETQFGMRDIAIDGTQFLINGRPLYLRGTVENCCFPETGYPPTDIQSWMKVFRKCREYGINHVRFHSYCPPEAAFAAADVCGIYLQPEGPSWPNHGVKLRRGQVIDQYLLDESKRIVDTYGHHPSFVMMAAGNEPAGDWVAYGNDWVREMHQYDSTKVYCAASVGGGWAWDSGSQYHVKGGARGLDWDRHAPQSIDDYSEQIRFPRNYKDTQPNHSPIIAHEQGQWCAFPDLSEIPQYSGCAYKAGNFEIFRDLLKANGMENMAQKFLMASGNLQTLCYKYEIERNLRTPNYAGFQLLSLNDYSGQGSAIVGPLNVFWREKPYTSAKQWRQFCRALVPLARFPRFLYTTLDTLDIDITAYNALQAQLNGATVKYTIEYAPQSNVNGSSSSTDKRDGSSSSPSKKFPSPLGEGLGVRLEAKGSMTKEENPNVYSSSIASGVFTCDIPIGKDLPLGTIRQSLANIQAPAKLTLTVTIADIADNQWDFWVYPPPLAEPEKQNILLTDTLDQKALKTLQKGGKVLLTAAGRVTLGNDVKQTSLPIF